MGPEDKQNFYNQELQSTYFDIENKYMKDDKLDVDAAECIVIFTKN
jgi:hypothetical protein